MLRRGAAALLLVGSCAAMSTAASARLMDDIDIGVAADVIRVRIQFTVPVRYLRHFPPSQGEILNVYLQSLPGEGLRETLGHPQVDEKKRSPRNALLPCFTVTFVPPRDPGRDPLQLVIQFQGKETYKVRLGEDSRSLYLDLPATTDGRAPGGCNGKPLQ
jgi:hypothetical protein